MHRWKCVQSVKWHNEHNFNKNFPWLLQDSGNFREACVHMLRQTVSAEGSFPVSDNMKLTRSFIETKLDGRTSFQTVRVCFVRAIQTPRAVWINAVQHRNRRQKMKMDDLVMKNIPGSEVTHPLTFSVWLRQPMFYCATLNTSTIPCKVSVRKCLSLTPQVNHAGIQNGISCLVEKPEESFYYWGELKKKKKRKTRTLNPAVILSLSSLLPEMTSLSSCPRLTEHYVKVSSRSRWHV